MANWVRSPSQRWFTNAKWVQYAFENAKTSNPNWNSYYGSHPYLAISPGLNPDNPMYLAYGTGPTDCGICELLLNCSSSSSDIYQWLCQASQWNGAEIPYCESQDFICGVCSACENFNSPDLCEAMQDFCSSGSIPCDAIPTNCNFTYNIQLCSVLPDACTKPSQCLDQNFNFVDCNSEQALCNPCNGECDDFLPCPCGVDGCILLPPGTECPAICCAPGEPGCVECCADDNPDCGVWTPEDLCCASCSGDCQPYGYPMPDSFCQSCEYCNIDPTAEQCNDCCQCTGSLVYVDCEQIEQGYCDPPECADFSSNCYECGGSYIPIWFGCYEEDPCPNPFNPDCTTGEETVCYDFNTNDPIYYNPSALGASVVIEYNSPSTGTPYSYGNVATLCAVPDSLQLCVYLVDGSDNETQLTYEADFTINEAAATVTLESTVVTAGYAKLRFKRCSDDKRMFLTFKDGAKLSAEDLNTSLHQLLFLIQEKEFASNTYYQVANDDGQGGALFTVSPSSKSPFNFNLTSVTANDVLIWDGNNQFVGASPSQIAGNIAIDNLNSVNITSLASGQILSFNGTNWVNTSLPSAPTYFLDWENYDSNGNAALDDYYNLACDVEIDAAWANSVQTCVSNLPKDLIPNAITSFGLGYYAAEQQINDQLGNPSDTLPVYISNAINAAGGTILTSFRWEISRGEGRDIQGYSGYPVAYFDITDFDLLDHPNGVLTGSSSASTDVAYYRPFPPQTCSSCKNKLYITNIEKFQYSGDKSVASGLEFTSGTLNPTTDRYLNGIKSVLNKSDWGTALGYTNESHPLTGYLTNPNADYIAQVDGMITASYSFTDGLNLNNYSNTKHVPSVVTYYLSHLWDSNQVPSFIVWDGNMDVLGKIDESGIPVDVVTYLNTQGNYWFYWRWWIMGEDTTQTNTNPNQTQVDALSFYNPWDQTKLNTGTPNYSTILPASNDFLTDYQNDPDDLTMAKTGSYSIKVDANKAFSNLERVLPDMYDEYVFEVGFATAGRVSTANCPDANCYEIVAKVEKHIDGCYDGDLNCTQIGSGGTNTSGGYHIYPDDFNANVIRAWDSYPYEKIDIEIRNKTGAGFDLILKVPRLKRIGLLDVLDQDTYGTNPSGNYRQLALDFLTDYHYVDWDDPVNPNPGGDTDTKNSPPDYGDVHPNPGSQSGGGSAAAFSLETAVQFIRLGIPANIRVSFYTVSTPQTNLFEG